MFEGRWFCIYRPDIFSTITLVFRISFLLSLFLLLSFSMMRLVAFSSLVLAVVAQYPYNHNTGAYNPQYHQGSQSSNPAPVHYVNIGPQLQGDYDFGYDTGNAGSFRKETRGPDGSVSGSYGYIDASGQRKVIKYTAGKDGFKAEGDDIPKAPPAPQPQAPQYHQPQPAYQPPPQHNYVQPQQNYGAPQHNPYAYGAGQPQNNQLFSYNIGSGGQYQG